jgi:predicted glycogen debranching enzyme
VHPLPGNLTALWKKEMTRREATRRSRDKRLARAHGRTGGEAALRLREALDAAADAFLVDKPGLGQTVHAGYPWFGTSGRDLLIALPGLTFARAQLDLGVEILESYAAHCRHGLLPLSLETDGTARCTAVDPGLWFFWTVQQYLAYGGDRERVRTTLWPVMKSVVESAMRGTDNDIWVTDTGLLHAGRAGECVTWMDACIGDRPVTPRWGLMVEINALWYNALRFALELGEELDDRIEDVDESFCAQVQESFEATFHDPLGPGLLDTVNEYFLDDGTRPNQILAVSLPYAVLAGDAARQVTETVGEELFTPCGLRSLSPRDNRYRGACRGDVWERDLAYHQGSAWPWLAAHYAEACLRVYGKDDKTRARFDELIQTFTARLDEAGLGSVSELFDGDPPHTARGAIAQAWNVGELIRMLDVLGVGRSA